MLLFLFLVIVAVILAVAGYGLWASGMFSGGGDDYGFGKVPRLRELSPGCLLTIIVVGSLWFIVWGIVLILAIRLLRTPLD